MRALITQLLRFSVVGGFGFVIDVGVFNLLRLTVLSPEALYEGPVIAKVISTSLAIIANWIGNRYWTFGNHRRTQAWREGMEFALVSLGGMIIGLACLWVSHYVLGFTSLLADNIASNVIGLALGTVFRFWLYRTWVFSSERGTGRPVPAATRPRPASGLAPLSATGSLARLHRIQPVNTIDDVSTSGD